MNFNNYPDPSCASVLDMLITAEEAKTPIEDVGVNSERQKWVEDRLEELKLLLEDQSWGEKAVQQATVMILRSLLDPTKADDRALLIGAAFSPNQAEPVINRLGKYLNYRYGICISDPTLKKLWSNLLKLAATDPTDPNTPPNKPGNGSKKQAKPVDPSIAPSTGSHGNQTQRIPYGASGALRFRDGAPTSDGTAGSNAILWKELAEVLGHIFDEAEAARSRVGYRTKSESTSNNRWPMLVTVDRPSKAFQLAMIVILPSLLARTTFGGTVDNNDILWKELAEILGQVFDEAEAARSRTECRTISELTPENRLRMLCAADRFSDSKSSPIEPTGNTGSSIP